MRASVLRVLLASGALALAACESETALDRVPEGDWGGEHVALSVAAGGASVEFDCAHGWLDDPLRLDSQQQFRSEGRYVSEGGPLPPGQEPYERPAVYRGALAGSRLTFTVRLGDPDQALGPFSAELGVPPRLVKCR